VFPTFWLGMCLLAASPDGGPAPGDAAPTAAVLREYEAARAAAGDGADAQVGLALWCEAHGLNAERTRHLALAVLRDPSHAAARGLMGLMAYRGKWAPPDDVARRVQEDERRTALLGEYNARRDALDVRAGDGRAADRRRAARAHDELGRWCDEHGLKPEAVAHYTQSVALDPARDATWRRLGYVRYNDRWMSPERAAAARLDDDAQRKADREWEPTLRRWRARLARPSDRDEALAALRAVNDPRAVPALVRVFGDAPEEGQLAAVEALAGIDTAGSTRALAGVAVRSGSAAVRSAACLVLRRREPRDYAEDLVLAIRSPVRYSLKPVGGPGDPGGILLETPRARVLRRYDAPPIADLSNLDGMVMTDPDGLPVIYSATYRYRELGGILWSTGSSTTTPAYAAYHNPDLHRAARARTVALIAAANLKAQVSEQRLINDVQTIEAFNARTALVNERVRDVLRAALDAPDLKDDEDAWRTWWNDRIGYRYERPEPVEYVVDASPVAPAPVISATVFVTTYRARSCFAAGTPVHTLDGRRSIESLRVGDRVLTQDTATGALSFQPVLVVHHNPPTDCVALAFDNGEKVTASIYHRFYRAGKGWAQARELEPGDLVRTLGGLARVVAADRTGPVPVYNLDVAATRTYFVGGYDLLVHDNTLPDPRAVLFDATPAGPATRSE
jgi:hypothetical protein